MDTLTPRPLRSGEVPSAGDLFFQRGSQLLSVLIRLATGSDINHTGVVLSVNGDGSYLVAEANGPGFEVATKNGFTGYVVRVSDSAEVRARLAGAAVTFASHGFRYDYLAIARFAAIVLGRARPRTVPGRVLVGLPAWVGRGVGRFLLWVLPDERPDRVICSGSVRRLLRDTFGEGAWADGLPLRDDETSPADLLGALLGRRRW